MPYLWVAAAALLGACQLPADTTTAPAAPTNLRIIAGSPPTLAWDAVSGATAYAVYRSSSWDEWPPLLDLESRATFIDVENEGYYTVAARNSEREGLKAGPPVLMEPPAAPGNVRIEKRGAQHYLEWNAVLGSASYAVYRSADQSPDPFPPAPEYALVAVLECLIPGPGYCYWVAARDAAGNESILRLEKMAYF